MHLAPVTKPDTDPRRIDGKYILHMPNLFNRLKSREYRCFSIIYELIKKDESIINGKIEQITLFTVNRKLSFKAAFISFTFAKNNKNTHIIKNTTTIFLSFIVIISPLTS